MTAAREIGKAARRASAVLLLALALVMAGSTGVLGTAFAADADGAIAEVVLHPGSFSPNVRYFDSYSELAAYVKGLKDSDVKTLEFNIRMLDDWNATERLEIPANAHVSLSMQGHMINRALTHGDKSGAKTNGEVIIVQEGAVLTINGGPRDSNHMHEAYAYQSPALNPTDSEKVDDVSGGYITGGNSTNGAGGIHVKKGATVTLNDVTVGGCRAYSQKPGASGGLMVGYGGGMYLRGGGITVNMNGSTITGNYASGDGGGIYADNSNAVTINLKNSHIDANCAHSVGGGVGLDGKDSRIMGDASVDGNGAISGSSISRNKSSGQGGGVLVRNSGITVDGLALEGNLASNGGGIHVSQDKVLLKNLVIRGNRADNGGGVYFAPGPSDESKYAGDTVVDGCTITGNIANASGGGVYCDEHSAANGKRKRTLSGVMVIKDNTVQNGSDYRNLCISSQAWSAKDESFNLSEGSEVWASWAKKGDLSRKSANKDSDCAQYLQSDQSGYCFAYNVGQRCINRVTNEEAPTVPAAVKIPAANANNASGADKSGSNTVAGKIGTVGAGGASGSDYSLVRGFASHGGSDEVSSFYYSDGLFYDSPYTYNEHLATLSLTFAYCGGYMNNFAEKDANGNTYYNKHWGAKQFLADIGCPDQNIYVSDSMIVKPGTDSVGVTIGSKELTRADGTKTGDILIPVAVRGFGYEAEWVSNVTIGYAAEMGWQKEAKGFSEAASYVYKEIEYYVKKHDLFDAYKAGKVKFWITGYSRAGATANLTAKRLVDAIANDRCGSQVFCYPCEAPKGGTDDAETAGHNYNCIHNLINKADLVPYVAPEQMGFKRYGVDHYIPGTAVGEVKATVKSVTHGGSGGPGKVTTQADNTPTLTKTNAYNQQKTLMLKQLTALNPDLTFNDHFQPQALDFISTSGFVHVYDEGNYADNHIEDFVEDFIWLLVKKSDISRDMYARDSYTLNGKTYPSIQAAARNLMQIAKSGDGLSGIVDSAGNIKNDIPYVSFLTFWPFGNIEMTGSKAIDYSAASLYLNVIGEWGSLSDSDKAAWTRSLWNTFVKAGALDKLSAEDKDKLEAAFPTILNVALLLVDSDYNFKPKNNINNQWAKGSNETMMYIPTLAEHISAIEQNHDQNVNLAWARSYDSWYQDDIDNLKLASPASVEPPEAYGMAFGKLQKLEVGEGKENKLAGDQRIVFDNENIVGEAVYYDLYDVTAGNAKLATNRLYRGGVDLVRGDVAERTFEIVAYDMSYGVKSGAVTYRVTLTDTMHKVIVRDLAADGSGAVMSGASTAEDAPLTGQGSGAGAGESSAAGQSALSVQGQSSGDGIDLVAGTVSGGLRAAGDEGSEAGEDYSAYRTREYAFVEGQKALVKADEPSTLYFKTWTVEVLDREGNVVADATTSFLPYGGPTNPFRFTVPKEGEAVSRAGDGKAYPEGYQLRFTAQYVKRIEKMTVQAQAPVKGGSLPKLIEVQFDNGKSETYRASWTYRRGESQGWMPAPSTVMPGTVYRAVIEAYQDGKNDIVFTDNVSIAIGGQSGEVETWKSEEDSNTGSIFVRMTFKATESDPEPQPDPTMAFTVSAFDLNTNQPISGISETFAVQAGDSVTLVAPRIENKAFMGWDFEGFDPSSRHTDPSEKTIEIELPNGSLQGDEIVVNYVPVISSVEANLYDKSGNVFKPEAGGTGPDRREVLFTVGEDVYEVNPETLSVSWSPEVPEDGRFAPLTSYMGSVKVAFTNGEGEAPTVSARKKDSGEAFRNIGITSLLADDFEARFNGSAQDAMADFAEQTVSTLFPATAYTLGTVKQPDSISGLPYADGSNETWVRQYALPSTTRILTTRGIEFDAGITWTSLGMASEVADAWSAGTWKAYGKVTLPDVVANPDNVSLDVSMTVSYEDAGTALSPTASPGSGTFLYNQVVTLTVNEPTGTTYYTTDGSDPRDSTTSKVYTGEEIFVNRADAKQVGGETGYKAFTIKAYTVAGNATTLTKRPSEAVTYEYAFSDIPVPQGAQLEYAEDSEGHGVEQVGVEGSPFYTLTVVEGDARIVDGDAVATDPGVYKVRAHLNDASDYWELDGSGRSQEDQVIEFTITGEKGETCTVAVAAQPKEGGTVAGGGAYEKGATATVTATPNEGYAFVNWTKSSSEAIEAVSGDAEYSFKVESGRSLSANFTRILTVKWLDGDGSELYSATYNEGDEEPAYQGGKTPTRAPTAARTYTFAGWDSGRVSDTVKTYKPLFDATPNKYRVTFVDEDGTVLKEAAEYDYDTLPEDMDIPAPAKAATAQYSYAFDAWVNMETGEDLGPVVADATYKATYTATLNEYRVTFEDYNGKVLQSESVRYGDIPSYKGEVPKRAAADQCSYVFNGWSPAIEAVTGDAAYTATYMEIPTPMPAMKGALSFDFAGGVLDGETSLVIVANVDDVITIPEAPTREGHTFKYWKGSEYRPGDQYTVKGDHAFTAVWEQDAAIAPDATLETGEYLFDQQTKLDTHDQGGTTYYTTDGSDPTTSPTRQVYNDKAIHVNRSAANQVEEGAGRKAFVLKAYTAVAGMGDSDVATYEYVFSDVPVPQGEVLAYTGEEQTGVVRTPFYTLEPVGEPAASIDYKGNAVATEPGVYQVKAILDPDSGADRWATDDEQGWSAEDQIVGFVITGKKDNRITIAVQASPREGGTVLGGGTYEVGDSGTADVTVSATANQGYAFVNWTESNSESVEVVSRDAEYSFKASDGRSLTAHFARACTVRWLDDDGSVLHEATYLEGEDEPAYPAGGKTPAKAPTAAYTYTFSKWDEGSVADNVKTYQPLFDETLNKYNVTFVNYNGTLLQTGVSEYGSIPSYKGDVPKRVADEKSSYVFSGWSPEIESVTGDATYTAQFMEAPLPSQKASLTFDFGGGTLDGKTSLTIVADVGDVITIPNAPTKDGYDFKCWKGSEYHPGDKYTVEGDHAFTAVWEQKAVKPSGDANPTEQGKDATTKGSSAKSSSAKTGDSLLLTAVLALIALADMALIVAIFARAHRRDDSD